MPRGKVAFVVEGDLEKDFLARQCGTKSVIRKITCNGEDVPIGRITALVKAIVATLHNPSHIFVVLDREGRAPSAETLEELLHKELLASGITYSMSVHFADRMVENWILADAEVLGNENLNVDLSTGIDGVGGKGKLKQAFRELDQTYSERIDGVRLLEKCSSHTLAKNSTSFARLYSKLKAASLPCHWIKR